MRAAFLSDSDAFGLEAEIADWVEDEVGAMQETKPKKRLMAKLRQVKVVKPRHEAGLALSLKRQLLTATLHNLLDIIFAMPNHFGVSNLLDQPVKDEQEASHRP